MGVSEWPKNGNEVQLDMISDLNYTYKQITEDVKPKPVSFVTACGPYTDAQIVDALKNTNITVIGRDGKRYCAGKLIEEGDHMGGD